MTWLHGVTLLVKTLSEFVKLAEKWAYHIGNYSLTSVNNDVQLVHPNLFH